MGNLRNRKRVTFSVDIDLIQAFQVACGAIPMSRQMEEIIRTWLKVLATEYRPENQLGANLPTKPKPNNPKVVKGKI